MILQIQKNCFIEGRRYVVGMVVDFPDYIEADDVYLSIPDQTNTVTMHRSDDLEKTGIIEGE
jgi:hypothetical protein